MHSPGHFLFICTFLFPCTLFVPFGTFFTHVSTPTTTATITTKLLLGPLSVARGQKGKRKKSSRYIKREKSEKIESLEKQWWLTLSLSFSHHKFIVRTRTSSDESYESKKNLKTILNRNFFRSMCYVLSCVCKMLTIAERVENLMKRKSSQKLSHGSALVRSKTWLSKQKIL